MYCENDTAHFDYEDTEFSDTSGIHTLTINIITNEEIIHNNNLALDYNHNNSKKLPTRAENYHKRSHKNGNKNRHFDFNRYRISPKMAYENANKERYDT